MEMRLLNGYVGSLVSSVEHKVSMSVTGSGNLIQLAWDARADARANDRAFYTLIDKWTSNF
jgi:hypothetical protein